MAEPHRAPLDLLIKKLDTHHPLTDGDRGAILALPCKTRSLEAQSYLVREGDRPQHCAVILSGFAFRHKLTGDGARQILALLIPGEAVDLQHLYLPEADHNVQMLTRGEVAEVPMPAFEELARAYPNLGRAILTYSLVEASTFREWALNVGRRDGRSRIAHLLCEFAIRLTAQGLKPDGPFELPMTQEQLADATGLTPVHVNRVLKALQSEGLIQRNRRVVSFPEWQRMREVADFNTRYLHITAPTAQLH